MAMVKIVRTVCTITSSRISFDFWQANFLATALDGSISLNMLAILFECTATNQWYLVTVQSWFQKSSSLNWIVIRFTADETMKMIDVEDKGAWVQVH